MRKVIYLRKCKGDAIISLAKCFVKKSFAQDDLQVEMA